MVIAGKISDMQLRAMCRMGHGPETCRYISAGPEGFMCQKGTATGAQIDARVEAGLFIARGDNCPGLSVEIDAPGESPWAMGEGRLP